VIGPAALMSAAAFAAAGSSPKVTIHDNYYAPAKLTVKQGTTVKWVWPEIPVDVHDVKLKKGPKGAKRFWSDPASSSYTFKRKLTKPGAYSIICTLHEEMTMSVKVRAPKT
jgi:plastocyanin